MIYLSAIAGAHYTPSEYIAGLMLQQREGLLAIVIDLYYLSFSFVVTTTRLMFGPKATQYLRFVNIGCLFYYVSKQFSSYLLQLLQSVTITVDYFSYCRQYLNHCYCYNLLQLLMNVTSITTYICRCYLHYAFLFISIFLFPPQSQLVGHTADVKVRVHGTRTCGLG